MTIEEIKDMVEKEEYDFLRTNPHLSGRLVFLTLGGSYAYGTNVETSDVDIRGCALNRKSDLLGLSNFEQVVNTETDTTVYSFNKLVSLLINCNPNTIELLGCKPEHYFLLTDVGRQMIENRGLFLKQEICTYRENDRDFLLSIRNGAFQNEDGTYKQEFFELVSDYEARLRYAKENTSLPEKPNMKRIEEFVVSVNEKSVNL